MNDNMLGKVIALALILGAVYSARSIAHGGFSCPLGDGSRCLMSIPATSPAPAIDANAPAEKAAPVEKDSDGDEDAIEKKAPVAPPAPAAKTDTVEKPK